MTELVLVAALVLLVHLAQKPQVNLATISSVAIRRKINGPRSSLKSPIDPGEK
ncbi:MAG: hypothetical protein KGQ51_06430 [Planctomycetes bacterium]|nr:hypothetical protein [Planctomycetota bacterium]